MCAFLQSGRGLIVALVATIVAVGPAAAQQQQAPQQTPNDDLRLKTVLGFEYRLDPQWRLTLDAQLVLDHDISRARDLEFRPGVEYALTPHWAVVAGYVQYQDYPAGLISNRGPFEDIAYGRDFGRLSLANRLRTEELFFDNNGALLIRTRYRLSAEHPLGDSPWGILVSDEIYLQSQDRRHEPCRRLQQERVLWRAGSRDRARRQGLGRLRAHLLQAAAAASTRSTRSSWASPSPSTDRRRRAGRKDCGPTAADGGRCGRRHPTSGADRRSRRRRW